jgi:uncharacterized protein (TIGR04255 family)
MPTTLPEFTKPPVTEVALSVSYAPLDKWRSAHAGMYWGRINATYPLTQVHPPLPVQLETFEGKAVLVVPQFQVDFVVNPDTQRYWFTTDPPVRVVQIQNNRFVVNWRKVQGDESYPRYASDLRSKFIEEWNSFTEFLAEQKFDAPVVQQCEITYVNTILQDEGWTTFEEARSLFSQWSAKGSDGYLPPPESLALNGTFLMPDHSGRLHVTCQRVIRPTDERHAVHFQLYAVSKPKSSELNDIVAQLDIGHEWIVRGFADLTSPHAHKLWGRTQ